MAKITIEWVVYFILVVAVVVFLIVIFMLISPRIFMASCVNDEWKEILNLLEIHSREFRSGESLSSLYKKVDFSEKCVNWVVYPCSNEGFCIGFKTGEIKCANTTSNNPVFPHFPVILNTRGILLPGEYNVVICKKAIEFEGQNIVTKEDDTRIPKEIIDEIKIKCGGDVFSKLDTSFRCKQ